MFSHGVEVGVLGRQLSWRRGRWRAFKCQQGPVWGVLKTCWVSSTFGNCSYLALPTDPEGECLQTSVFYNSFANGVAWNCCNTPALVLVAGAGRWHWPLMLPSTTCGPGTGEHLVHQSRAIRGGEARSGLRCPRRRWAPKLGNGDAVCPSCGHGNAGVSRTGCICTLYFRK